MLSRASRAALLVVLPYILVAGLWIWLSDRLLFAILTDREAVATLEVFKGLAFVIVTALLLFFLMQRAFRQRHTVEADLRASQERYRQLFEDNPQPMWVYDLETLAVLTVNQAAIAHYGYTREEWGTMTLLDFHPPEVHASLTHTVRSVPGRLRRVGVWPEIKKDGARIEVEISTHDLMFDGRPARLVLAHDVTEQRQAEQALRESEERFRLLVESVQDYAIFLLDPEGHIASWNSGAERIKGYTAQEIIGRHISCFYLADEVAAGKPQRYLEVARTTGRCEDEGWRVRADGTLFWANAITTALRDPDGRLRGFVKLTRDLTERKRAEEALRASQQQLAGVIDSAMDAIITVNAEQRIVLFNAAAEAMFRCPMAEALDGPLDKFIPERWRAAHARHIRVFGATGVTNRRMGALGDVSGLRADGTEFPIEASISQVVVAGQRYFTVILRDITERKRAEAELQRRADRLRNLRQIDRDIIMAQTPTAIARSALQRIRQLIPCQRASLALFNPELTDATLFAVDDTGEAGLTEGARIGVEPRMVQVLHAGQVLRVDDTSALLEPVSPGVQALIRQGYHSLLSIPLRAQESLIGALTLSWTARAAISSEQEEIALEVANQLAIAIYQARLLQSVEEQREQLRGLAARLAEVEEAERKQLARELHDRVGQSLTALSINYNIIRSQLSVESEARVGTRLEDALQLIRDTAARVRDVMAELRPPVLDDYGLLATLRWYGEQFTTRTGVAVNVDGREPAPRLAASVENHLYRIVQEALTNVAKHARASRVTLTLEPLHTSHVRLTIADDGVGFNPDGRASPGRAGGWGLMTMRERAQTVDGQFRVESAPGQGTRIVVDVG